MTILAGGRRACKHEVNIALALVTSACRIVVTISHFIASWVIVVNAIFLDFFSAIFKFLPFADVLSDSLSCGLNFSDSVNPLDLRVLTAWVMILTVFQFLPGYLNL